MLWSEDDFRKRVEARALELGKSLARVQREAGVAEEYLRKVPRHGRNVAGIFKIANALDINPAELMGLGKMADEVTLDFIAVQQRALLAEMRLMRSEMTEIRDDVRVLTSMAIRQDNRAVRMQELLHSTIERVRSLEDTQ